MEKIFKLHGIDIILELGTDDGLYIKRIVNDKWVLSELVEQCNEYINEIAHDVIQDVEEQRQWDQAEDRLYIEDKPCI